MSGSFNYSESPEILQLGPRYKGCKSLQDRDVLQLYGVFQKSLCKGSGLLLGA